MKTVIVLAHQTKNGNFQNNAYSALTAHIPDTYDEWKKQSTKDGFPLFTDAGQSVGFVKLFLSTGHGNKFRCALKKGLGFNWKYPEIDGNEYAYYPADEMFENKCLDVYDKIIEQ